MLHNVKHMTGARRERLVPSGGSPGWRKRKILSSTMKRLASGLGVGLLLLALTPTPHASPGLLSPAQKAAAQLDRMRAWFDAVRAHRLGVEDAPAGAISAWST